MAFNGLRAMSLLGGLLKRPFTIQLNNMPCLRANFYFKINLIVFQKTPKPLQAIHEQITKNCKLFQMKMQHICRYKKLKNNHIMKFEMIS